MVVCLREGVENWVSLEIMTLRSDDTVAWTADGRQLRVRSRSPRLQRGGDILSSLGCHGNGNDAAVAQPALQGVDDLVIRYGLYDSDGTADGVGQSPTEFMTASKVSAQANVGGRTPWQRVTAVSVCVLVRSVANGRQEDNADNVRTYTNCRGETIELPSGNRYVYKIYQRVFAVRNNLSAQL